MDSKSNISIWKIKDQFVQSHENDSTRAIESIRNEYNQSASVRQDLAAPDDTVLRVFPTKRDLDLPGENHIKILHKRRRTNSWQDFISPTINTDAEYESFGLESSNADLVIFIYKDHSIFAVTTGAGYFVIQNYIDEDYPFEIAKRMLSGGFRQADTRSLTGSTYAESRNFRRSYTFNSQDAFGKVWKKLYGEVDKNFLQSTTYLKQFIDVDKAINAEIKSSFTLRKSITFHQLVQLVEELRTILARPLSEEKKKLFRFLESAELIKDKVLSGKLDQELLKSLYKVIVEHGNDSKDFDFCHPNEPLKFLSASEYYYSIGRIKRSFGEATPTYEEIVNDLKESGEFENLGFNEFVEKINKCIFRASSDDEEMYPKPLADKLIRYFHGELGYQGSCYFRIDAKWYRAEAPFLESLYGIFIEQITNSDIINHTIAFEDYPEKIAEDPRDNREGRFNRLQASKEAFYYGDMIYARYGSGEIELFDLLHFEGENRQLHIIQVKEGFAGSMRDACSQIAMAAQAIEDDLRSGGGMLKVYYLKWCLAEQNRGVSEAQFLELFQNNKRVYVIACAHKKEFKLENLSNKRFFQSHIAKFEMVGIAQEFRAQSRSFQLMRIKKND